jgi:hypothetical protein
MMWRALCISPWEAVVESSRMYDAPAAAPGGSGDTGRLPPMWEGGAAGNAGAGRY